MSGLSFTGKVVLVTGASSNVGSEIAKYFSKLGASLVLTDCDKFRLNKVSDEWSGVSVLNIAADLTKHEDVVLVIKETIKEFKKLDVLINVVGPHMNNCSKDGDHIPSEELKSVLNFNVCSVNSLSQLAYPYLVKTTGNVVNVVGSLAESSSALSYNVSRAALDELTKSLASKFHSEGVRVNEVCGGLDETLTANPAEPSEKSGGPRKQLGPEDLAAAVVFLASDLATFITGANLPVTGGKHLAWAMETDKGFQRLQDKKLPAKPEDKPNPILQTGKKETTHTGSSKVDSPALASQKEEQAKHSPPKPEGKKSDADKSTTVKFHNSEKVGKPASSVKTTP